MMQNVKRLLNFVKKSKKAIYFATQRCEIAKFCLIWEENEFNMYILLQKYKTAKICKLFRENAKRYIFYY